MKVCVICKHFTLSIGYSGYSESTPGSPGSIDCVMSSKRGCPWRKMTSKYDEGAIDIPPLISVAEACPYYEEITSDEVDR